MREGTYCAGVDGCIPTGPDAGTASFGDRPARLVDAGGGRLAGRRGGRRRQLGGEGHRHGRPDARGLHGRLRPGRRVARLPPRRARDHPPRRPRAHRPAPDRAPCSPTTGPRSTPSSSSSTTPSTAGSPGGRSRSTSAVHPGRLVLAVVGGTRHEPGGDRARLPALGRLVEAGGRRIGRYGQGGKAAIGHLGNRFEIVASAAGDEHAYGFEDPAYRDRARLRTYDLHPRKKAVAAALGYVRIEIGEVDRKLDPRRLARAARGDLPPDARGGRGPDGRQPGAGRAPSVGRRRAARVRRAGAGRLVRGWWGLLPEPPAPGAPEAGVRLYHLGRLVGAPEWFGHPTPAAHPALNRLVGEVELPHVPVTMNKADVDRGSEAWAAVEARLHALLAPVVRRLTREPASAVTPEAAADGGAGAQDPGEGPAAPGGRSALRIGGRRGGRRARRPAGARGGPETAPRRPAER